MTKIKRHYTRMKDIDDAKLKRLWPSRMSECEMAKALGRHRNTVRKRAIKLGLPSSRRAMWEETP